MRRFPFSHCLNREGVYSDFRFEFYTEDILYPRTIRNVLFERRRDYTRDRTGLDPDRMSDRFYRRNHTDDPGGQKTGFRDKAVFSAAYSDTVPHLY